MEVLSVKLDIRKLFSAFFLLVFLGSTTMFVLSFFDKQKGEASYQMAESLANIAVEVPVEDSTEAPTEESIENTEPSEPVKRQWKPAPVADKDPYLLILKHLNLRDLRAVNPQVAGWIYIPDTKVNYPILHGEDNDYYLTHTWEGNSNACGSIFLEAMNSARFTDFNTIIYGHNMKNGSMFSTLHDYVDLSFWEQHPYVYLVTDEGVVRYEIFSSYDAGVNSQAYGLSFHKVQTREEFIQAAVENSDIDVGIVPEVTDRILTLSTCTGWSYRERRVVHAYLPMELSE